ncbi:LPS export ABC transporter periplasmic protein LptC [Rhodoblastus sphagnicola]|uniref:LPS export ABC transporter periplasmic protein LptC n=1 Tax=Rhodoblastus sphagnicola TaxID=333368 RepID=A0A2S6MUI2_9HYPH|nr:LPS export ABC transporter periplasmic protein LptC [Rhodoblastus sphagnicola]MBB4196967.1 lipopolysaccharide export system protein LptC [Rhodoblastus sphagnicola]PPQ26021.1 LPS export ABC transporter periplasmic protein LptC [Rhodoblastus sphagnicola]
MSQGGYMRGERQQGHFGDGLPDVPAHRQQAFVAASRHSRRVRLVRLAIVGSAVLGVIVLIGSSFFRAPETPGAHLQLDKLGLSGDKITMENPKLTGVRRDGRPFEVTARSGVQNPRDPSRMELTALDAKLRMTDEGDTRVVGDRGSYDSNGQTLLLSGHVRITSGSYNLAMDRALMNFKTNAMSSNDPVLLTFADGSISADSIAMSDNGAQLSFIGNVQSTFRQGDGETSPARQN